MDTGSRELTRAVAAYVTGLAFAVTFLLTAVMGAAVGTALLRGVIVAAATRLVAPFFVRPVLTTLFDAVARDREAAKAAAEAKAAEEEAEGLKVEEAR